MRGLHWVLPQARRARCFGTATASAASIARACRRSPAPLSGRTSACVRTIRASASDVDPASPPLWCSAGTARALLDCVIA
eukprot:2864761-Prymnesium_polylepis.2